MKSLCGPMDCSPPGSSVHGIFQARVLECGAISFSQKRLEISSKRIRDTKGIFHAKMGTIKERNGTDLTEQKRLRRGGKHAQKNCTKKIFTTQITTMV